ncbi:MAG TPA: riboflavin synthase subunit beta, partial [Flavobacteriaceae bacterium]|nr:riboflavin synthase subunit beta [Flavobacteriaceae bacterium]
MALFNLRKNKKYNYTGRFSEEKTYIGTHAKPKKIKSKFDEYRTTIGDNNGFRKKFRYAIEDYKKGSDNSVRKRL